MTRHTYRPGGATYYPMDGSRQGAPLEPEDVIAALDAAVGGDHDSNIIAASRREMRDMHVIEPRAEHWSPWLPWKGGPCPLPDRAQIAVEFRGGHTSVSEGAASHVRWRHTGERGDIIRFRYRADNPAGWLPRGDWIPPSELWADGCPVRCEWTRGMKDADYPGTYQSEDWPSVTHIRLVAREAQAGLPEGFTIVDGSLLAPNGRVAFAAFEIKRHGPAAIRQAVNAWLREMGDE